MSDYKLVIKIAGELDSSLNTAVSSAQGMLNSLNGTGGGTIMSGFAKGFMLLGKSSLATLGLIGAGATAVGAEATKAGMTFESAMSQLAATMSTDKLDAGYLRLQDTILELGKTTNFTATEAAQAANVLAMAGYSAEDNMAALPTVLRLAGAGALEMETAATYLTSTLASMGLDRTEENFQHLADTMAKVATLAQTDVSGMGEAFNTMGANGAQLAGGVDEFAALAGVLANVNITGSEAGTHLRNIMLSLQKPRNDAAADWFDKLGVSAYDASGNMRPIMDVMQDISASMEGWTNEQKNLALSDMFKLTDQASAKALLAGLGEEYNNLFEAAQNSSEGMGASSEMYSTQLDNLKGDLDLMVSAAEGFNLAIYNAIVGDGEGGGLRGAVREVTEMIGELEEAFTTEGATGLAEEIGNQLSQIAEGITENAPEAITAATEFAKAFTSEVGSDENSTLIGGAAAAIITSVGENFATYTGEFATAAGNLISGLVTGFADENTGERWAEAGTQMIQSIGTWFSENGAEFGTTAGTVISQLAVALSEHAPEIFSAGIDIIAGLGTGIINAAVVLVEHAPAIIGNLVLAILTDGIPKMLELGLTLGKALLDGIIDIGDAVQDWWQGLWDMSQLEMAPDVSSYYVEHTDAINASIRDLADSSTAYQDLSEASNAFFTQLANGNITLQDAEASLASYDERYGMTFKDINGNDVTFMSGAELETAIYAYKELANQAVQSAIEAETANQEIEQSAIETSSGLSESTQAARDALETAASSMTDTGSSMAEEFSAMKDEMVSSVEGVSASLDTDFAAGMNVNALNMLLESIDAGSIDTIVEQLSTAVTNMQTSVETSATGMQTAITNAMTSIGTSVTVTSLLISADITAMSLAVAVAGFAIVASANSTASGITSAFSGINLYSIGVAIMDGLTNGIRSAGARAVAAAQQIASQVASAMSSALSVHSPSRVTYQIGDYAGQGLENALADHEAGVRSASEEMASNVALGTNDALSRPLRAFSAQAESGGDGSAEGSATSGIVFSPQITITGNASQEDVQSALSWSMQQFEAMYDRMMSGRRRTAFA